MPVIEVSFSNRFFYVDIVNGCEVYINPAKLVLRVGGKEYRLREDEGIINIPSCDLEIRYRISPVHYYPPSTISLVIGNKRYYVSIE